MLSLAIGMGGAFAADAAPLVGVNSLGQANFFPRTLSAFLRGSPNAIRLMVRGFVIPVFYTMAIAFYEYVSSKGIPKPNRPTGGGYPYGY